MITHLYRFTGVKQSCHDPCGLRHQWPPFVSTAEGTIVQMDL